MKSIERLISQGDVLASCQKIEEKDYPRWSKGFCNEFEKDFLEFEGLKINEEKLKILNCEKDMNNILKYYLLHDLQKVNTARMLRKLP